MRLLLGLSLLFLQGCATKYILPGNRFMTPESQGGVFRTQAEFQQTSANQLEADLSAASVEDGVTYEVVQRTGFLVSTSLLDQLDLFWTHTGGGNSLLGAKFQFMGASRTGNGTGHKMAVSAAIGANEHESEGATSVEFAMKGQEFQLLYGFRFSEMFLLYSNFAMANYNFAGEVNSRTSAINGLKPEYETQMRSLYGGLEFDLGSFFAKLECGYQQLKTTDTKDESHILYGYSLGYSW